MPCESCRQFDYLKTWLLAEIDSWEFIRRESPGGLTERGDIILETLETVRDVMEKASE